MKQFVMYVWDTVTGIPARVWYLVRLWAYQRLVNLAMWVGPK